MEFIIYLVIGLGLLIFYIKVAQFVIKEFYSASGLSKVFWFFILMGTFSFLFGNSNSSGSNNLNNSFGGGGEDEEFWSNDDSSYCSWDSDTTSWDCDDD